MAVLLEELQWLLQQDSAAWQQLLEGLRQRADAFDPPDAYDAHMEMGFLLASRWVACPLPMTACELMWQLSAHCGTRLVLAAD